MKTMNWVILATLALLTVGCAGSMKSKGETTIGNTHVGYEGTSFNPEAAVYANAHFVRQAVAAETESELVKQGRMPYYPGGCGVSGRCWRHYGNTAPIEGGVHDRSSAPATERGETDGTSDRDEELERLRRERDEAVRTKDEALGHLEDLTEALGDDASNGQ
jgi:hypothetical protein